MPKSPMFIDLGLNAHGTPFETASQQLLNLRHTAAEPRQSGTRSASEVSVLSRGLRLLGVGLLGVS